MTTVAATSNTNSTATKTDTSKLSGDFDQFLTLLTTQLKNQDPLSPMDSTQFTNQLVSFSQVEQQIKLNDKLTSLLSYSKANEANLALSYIGLQVTETGGQFKYLGSNTTTSIQYTLPEDASMGTVTIKDAKGNTVYHKDAELAKGSHTFTWDGLDDNGKAVDKGTYKISVSASNAKGATLNVPTVVPGIVEGMQTNADGTISLLVNDTLVPMSEITQAKI